MPHIHELIDWTVGVFIVQDKKVLLVWHKKFGCWLCPGGHVELDEDPSQAAIREAKEETGFDIELVGEELPQLKDGRVRMLTRPRYMDIHKVPGHPNHQHIGLAYWAKIVGGEMLLSVEEHDHIGWYDAETVKTLDMYASTRFYALKAIEELS